MLTSNILATVPRGVGVFEVPVMTLLTREGVQGVGDDELLAIQTDVAALRRAADTNLAVLAHEVARRSHHSLGHSGLAQRLGSRTPQQLVQNIVGGSARDAAALVRMGALLDDSHANSESDGHAGDDAGDTTDGNGTVDADTNDASRAFAPPREPWLQPISHAIAEARLSVTQGDVIARGLGQPDALVSAQSLREAATQLAAEATVLTLEQLAARARAARALLDLDADPVRVDERESALRDRRYLHLSRQADGMTRLSGLLDPESAALVRSAVDAATSPRRGGPRFVSADDDDRAERMLRDPRTTQQLAHDALVELIRLGGAIAPAELVGVSAPAVQVIVAERDLTARSGFGYLEGHTEPVSPATVERHVCASGSVPVVIDAAGDVVALGREHRLYTRRQRIALAARDGGCRFPGCERPPSWTEAHHIVPWSEGGRTDLRDGVLLCRHHHLLLHNNGWQFTRVDDALHVIPPPEIDPAQRPIPAPTKSRALERARAG